MGLAIQSNRSHNQDGLVLTTKGHLLGNPLECFFYGPGHARNQTQTKSGKKSGIRLP